MSTVLQVTMEPKIKYKTIYEDFIDKHIIISPSIVKLKSSDEVLTYVKTKDRVVLPHKLYYFLYKENNELFLECYDMNDKYDYDDIYKMNFSYNNLNRMYEISLLD